MLSLYIDGASRGNPGQSSCAFIIEKNGKIVEEKSQYLGIKTNNQAEYMALLMVLERVIEMNELNVQIFSDSELLVKQINGFYQVKSENLRPLFQKYLELKQKLTNIEIYHISRERNKLADKLCNQELNMSFL